MKTIKMAKNSILTILFVLSTAFNAHSQTKFSNSDLTGTWRGSENGNRITLEIVQNGTKLTGYLSFVDSPQHQKIRITGTVSKSIDKWNVYKIEWKRQDEYHTYIGYTFGHGNDAGRGIAGYFHRPGMSPEGNCGWYVTR